MWTLGHASPPLTILEVSFEEQYDRDNYSKDDDEDDEDSYLTFVRR